MQKILIIQTAFLGDVVLATGLVEKLRTHYPNATLDFMLRRGNEGLLVGHPYLRRLWIWDKKREKYRGLWRLLWQLRQERYDLVINLQRFASSGWVTALSGAERTVGFAKNPFSRFFSARFPHQIGDGTHETARNHQLIADLTDAQPARPRLYPSADDFARVRAYQQATYVCIAPASVWFTKQFPAEQWVRLLDALPPETRVYLIGAPGDHALAESIRSASEHPQALNLCGEFSLLQSAALMAGAQQNYVNDSGPMHLASAMNAPTRAVFCSTVPAFGFGPLSDDSAVVEVQEPLACRPCGLHGYRQCPQGHFRCAHDIRIEQFFAK
ncbi:heptosyltransferase-2 [Catalinimonas alkaloidigena]|uniref:Heptosyltransferase-2 n=1 Tax=Catalinimonas alkaloidigena TaxID=1075417 RepID=A0A1G9MUW2_9BACT|nr:glycosyltransferase family 9 protein [Catalinimonas alkaloidigena]SDL77791.1 heptosyltransferase-2 [Catalinimonas alkaloidigena]